MGIVYMTSTTSGWKKKIIVACYLLVYFLRDSYIAIKCRFIKKKKKKRKENRNKRMWRNKVATWSDGTDSLNEKWRENMRQYERC